MGETVEFESEAGPTSGYLAVPTDGSGPAVIVIQEWWGLVAHIKDVAERFAAEGFVALAPDLFHGEMTTESGEAARKLQELKVADAARELDGAIDYLLRRPEVTGDKVGVVGFCAGGALAVVTANTAPDKVAAAVPFYGVFWYGDPQVDQVRAPMLMHVGTEDEWIPIEKVEALAEHVRSSSGTAVEVRTYEGAGHAFFNDTRPEAYDPNAASEAWAATLAFLRTHLS